MSLWVKDQFSGQYFGNVTLGTLKSGEAQNITVSVEGSHDVGNFVTTLLLDDIILDEHSAGYNGRPYSKVY